MLPALFRGKNEREAVDGMAFIESKLLLVQMYG